MCCTAELCVRLCRCRHIVRPDFEPELLFVRQCCTIFNFVYQRREMAICQSGCRTDSLARSVFQSESSVSFRSPTRQVFGQTVLEVGGDPALLMEGWMERWMAASSIRFAGEEP